MDRKIDTLMNRQIYRTKAIVAGGVNEKMFYWFTAFRTCIQYLYKNHLFYHQSFHSFCNIVFFDNVLMNTDRQSPFTHSSRITPLHCIFTAPCLVFKGTCAIQTVCLPTMCCLKRVVGKKNCILTKYRRTICCNVYVCTYTILEQYTNKQIYHVCR